MFVRDFYHLRGHYPKKWQPLPRPSLDFRRGYLILVPQGEGEVDTGRGLQCGAGDGGHAAGCL